jgi:hypothetical protein
MDITIDEEHPYILCVNFLFLVIEKLLFVCQGLGRLVVLRVIYAVLYFTTCSEAQLTI